MVGLCDSVTMHSERHVCIYNKCANGSLEFHGRKKNRKLREYQNVVLSLNLGS